PAAAPESGAAATDLRHDQWRRHGRHAKHGVDAAHSAVGRGDLRCGGVRPPIARPWLHRPGGLPRLRHQGRAARRAREDDGFVEARADTGRPAYHPGTLLKLYAYGYLHRIRSSRRLEAECTRNLEVIWLTGNLRPDHWTIAAFRREHQGRFKAVLREFNLVC